MFDMILNSHRSADKENPVQGQVWLNCQRQLNIVNKVFPPGCHSWLEMKWAVNSCLANAGGFLSFTSCSFTHIHIIKWAIEKWAWMHFLLLYYHHGPVDILSVLSKKASNPFCSWFCNICPFLHLYLHVKSDATTSKDQINACLTYGLTNLIAAYSLNIPPHSFLWQPGEI